MEKWKFILYLDKKLAREEAAAAGGKLLPLF
jgi:hypothetical protein